MNVVPAEGQMREQLLLSTAWVREQLRRADIGRNFTLTIQIEGPIQEDGAKLTYTLDCSANYDTSVTGNSLPEVTWELLRRMGWKSKNAGLAIAWNGEALARPASKRSFSSQSREKAKERQMYRSITIVGHLGGEPEIRDLPSGSKAANFSVATNEPFVDKDGVKQPNTEWFRVVAYQTGETGLVTGMIQKWLHKGQMVFITGTPTNRKWVDQQGNNRTSFEIKLGPQSTIKMLGGTPGPKNEDPGAPAEKANGHVPNTETGDPGFAITDAPF